MGQLQSSGIISIEDIYDLAVFFGYTGSRNIEDLHKWAGWLSSNPDGTAPYSMFDFYGAYTRSNTKMGVRHDHIGGSNTGKVDEVQLWSGNFITNVANDLTNRTISPGADFIINDVFDNANYITPAYLTVRAKLQSSGSTAVPHSISVYFDGIVEANMGPMQNSGLYYWASLPSWTFWNEPMPPGGEEGSGSYIKINWS